MPFRATTLALVMLAALPLAACEYRPVLPTAAAPAAQGADPPGSPPPTQPPPSPPPPGPAPAGARLHMLFIGNSLTYVNDLPAMVSAMARAMGDTIDARMVAVGGFALEDHLAQGDAPRAIAEGGWDIVVLQQGPSTLPESRANLLQYSLAFASLIRQVGARPALYGVWPDETRLDFLDDGIDSYRLAAEAVDGMLFPAGLAWKLAWRDAPALPLYGADRFHPSPLGTYAAACVIYSVAFDKTPIGLPAAFTVNGIPVSFPAGDAGRVQQAAAEATGRLGTAVR